MSMAIYFRSYIKKFTNESYESQKVEDIQAVLRILVEVVLHENVDVVVKGNLYASVESLLQVLAFSADQNNTQEIRMELANLAVKSMADNQHVNVKQGAILLAENSIYNH